LISSNLARIRPLRANISETLLGPLITE